MLGRTRGKYLRKCVHAPLHAKTMEAKFQELWVTEIVSIFESLMVSLIMCERGIWQG